MKAHQRPAQAVILAGGRGTRLRPITDSIPKPMISFHGKPFLEYVLEMLREQGFQRVLLLLGYLPEVIVDHFGDGSRLGLDIEYRTTAPDDLTSHRVKDALELIDARFLLLYCDNYWPMQFDRLWNSYLESGAPAQVTVYANRDGYTRDSVKIGGDGFVEVFDRSRSEPDLAGVEISYAIMEKEVMAQLLPARQELLEQAVYPTLARRHQLHAYWTEHRYYSVGSHERLSLTETFLARKPSVILDRDGVLNKRPGRARYVRTPDEFHWLPGARDALRRFVEAGYRILVVSNQAGIARGLMSDADLEAINGRMRTEAEQAGGRIDAVYTCPHGWDDGCRCRKPAPGMLFQAQRENHLDLTRTWFIGDDERDEQAARAAGCRFAYCSAETPLLGIAERLLTGALEEART